MQLVDGKSFSQASFPEGVCFRESFKWLACRIYGRPFIFNVTYQTKAADKNAKDRQNALKVWDKQQAYLGAIKPFEGKKADYGAFLMNANMISLDTIRAWGDKAAKDGSAKYGLKVGFRAYPSLSHWRNAGAEASVLLGVYGTSSAGPWAHATSFFRDATGPRFFDPNTGEWEFENDEDPMNTIGHYLVDSYAGTSGGTHYVIKDYIVYTVTPA